ncbi:hypothetical protein D7V88_35725 [Corallococcus terminator]|uniref:Uncharacterized protein n=1 Tax=Corallococcus terminator TaxID=2316733 RepID=A0A3A8HTZ7_9BACT|nr:hypothetical protein D7V88_35725 [Corallococcus terminator]
MPVALTGHASSQMPPESGPYLRGRWPASAWRTGEAGAAAGGFTRATAGAGSTLSNRARPKTKQKTTPTVSAITFQ